MRTPSLYPDIKGDLKVIAKEVIAEENSYLDCRWLEIKEEIHSLAEQCKAFAKERRERGDG